MFPIFDQINPSSDQKRLLQFLSIPFTEDSAPPARSSARHSRGKCPAVPPLCRSGDLSIYLSQSVRPRIAFSEMDLTSCPPPPPPPSVVTIFLFYTVQICSVTRSADQLENPIVLEVT